MKVYDILIFTHLPSFYKVNLYNELAKSKNIYVVFIGSGSNIRIGDFVSEEYNFDYVIINHGQFEHRSVTKSCFSIIKLISNVKAGHVIVNGWDLPEFWLIILFGRYPKKGLALESSIFESSPSRVKKSIKKLFLNKLFFVLAAGAPHQRLLKALNFSGLVVKTYGVGLISANIHKVHTLPQNPINKIIYIGRLAKEKNLELLIKVVNTLPGFKLTLVGHGDYEDELMKLKSSQITFLGPRPNSELNQIFKDNHFLILPSTAEPWGLVVEEALRAGLPVIASNGVGCHEDLIVKNNAGLVFEKTSANELQSAIIEMSKIDVYLNLKRNVDSINWDEIRNQQIAGYSCNF